MGVIAPERLPDLFQVRVINWRWGKCFTLRDFPAPNDVFDRGGIPAARALPLSLGVFAVVLHPSGIPAGMPVGRPGRPRAIIHVSFWILHCRGISNPVNPPRMHLMVILLPISGIGKPLTDVGGCEFLFRPGPYSPPPNSQIKSGDAANVNGQFRRRSRKQIMSRGLAPGTTSCRKSFFMHCWRRWRHGWKWKPNEGHRSFV